MSNVKMFCDALPTFLGRKSPPMPPAGVAVQREPHHRPQPGGGRGPHLQQCGRAVRGQVHWRVPRRAGQRCAYIYLGHSEDAIHWTFDKDKIPFVNEKGEPFMPVYAYDPRLVKVEDTYYIIWCQDFYGASIGIAKTTDFKTFVRIENPFIPFNRNAVLFPRKINGMYTLLSRPSDSGHTPFGDIFLSQSPDMEFWGRHRHVMSKGSNWWRA